MTNEEAIFYLKQIREDYEEFIEGIKAIDFAINTLKSVPTIEINTNDIEYKAYCKGLEDGKKIGRPHGKWIYHEDWKNEGECPYECSSCGRTYDYAMNFCGHCGADMRNKGEEE